MKVDDLRGLSGGFWARPVNIDDIKRAASKISTGAHAKRKRRLSTATETRAQHSFGWSRNTVQLVFARKTHAVGMPQRAVGDRRRQVVGREAPSLATEAHRTHRRAGTNTAAATSACWLQMRPCGPP